MPFPRKLLNESEDIVLDLHPHWWFFAPPLLALIAAIVVGLLAFTATDIAALQVPLGVLILGLLAWFGWR